MRKNNDFWSSPLASSLVKSDEVKLPEMLFGYFIGPFGALLSSGRQEYLESVVNNILFCG